MAFIEIPNTKRTVSAVGRGPVRLGDEAIVAIDFVNTMAESLVNYRWIAHHLIW
jgi:hypothetical protein